MRAFGFVLFGVLVGVVLTLIVVPAISKWTGIVMPVWVDILLCFSIPAAFGGVLGALQLADIPSLIRSSICTHWNQCRISNAALAVAISSIGGIGGGIAAMLAMVLDKQISDQIGNLERLKYIGIGTVAGFLGFKLLRLVADRVDELLVSKEVRKQTAPLEKQIEQVVKTSSELSDAIPKYFDARDENAPAATVSDATAALERVLSQSPDNRTAAMMLGWLYANKPPTDPKKAIKLLSDTLAAMQTRGTSDPVNVADILFNRACYNYRLAESADEPEKTRLKEQMYKDLEESVRLKPDNARAAVLDAKDFVNVRGEQRFRTVTGQAQ